MNPDLQRLIHLQELDLVTERLRRRIAELPAASATLDARIASRTAAVDAVKQRVAANQTSRREIEKDLAAVQGRLSKFKNQLMEVKTNKEYQAMQKEISVAEEDVSSQETRMLECMEDADLLAVELRTAEAALKADRTEVARELEQLDEERADIERRLQQTLQERQTLAAQVSRDAMNVFERVAHGRKGLAVAEARDGLCTVCHVRLRPQVFNEVRRNDSLIQCDSCQRILYFVPAPSGATPQPQ
jgi:predicted  nucleic acid-binding Zn-ribbon protein